MAVGTPNPALAFNQVAGLLTAFISAAFKNPVWALHNMISRFELVRQRALTSIANLQLKVAGVGFWTHRTQGYPQYGTSYENSLQK